MRFYLGVAKPSWLSRADVPMFISRNAFEGMKTLPRAAHPWSLDSGGFTEITRHGKWRVNTAEFIEQVRRIRDEVGQLEWTAPMDWMTELCALIGSGEQRVIPHLQRSVDSWFELRSKAPDLPIIPVLQGGSYETYLESMWLYEKRGVDLRKEPLVGLGSVCRQQAEAQVAETIYALVTKHGLTCHAFGFKKRGLELAASLLHSADSLAWSFEARQLGLRDGYVLPGHDKPGPGRPKGHIHCGNCLEYAVEWYKKITQDPVIGERHYPWNTHSIPEARFRSWLSCYDAISDASSKRQLVTLAERDFPEWLRHSMVMPDLEVAEKLASGWQDPELIIAEREEAISQGLADENDPLLRRARADLALERQQLEHKIEMKAREEDRDLSRARAHWGKEHVARWGAGLLQQPNTPPGVAP